MNIHPLIVHFPIALLALYSFLELIRRFTTNSYWQPIRGFLVIIGTIGAFFSLSTGEIAEHLFKDALLQPVLELHQVTAVATTYLYALLALGYILYFYSVYKPNPHAIMRNAFIVKITRVIHWFMGSVFSIIIAIVAFFLLGLTGALGGILVYGPEFDPITSIVYKLFF